MAKESKNIGPGQKIRDQHKKSPRGNGVFPWGLLLWIYWAVLVFSSAGRKVMVKVLPLPGALTREMVPP